ncbi:hypothetical protein [Phenylobacterium sp.]|jgi:hypothetical protein|uniref:hypothetical protein n=1 Tax=Phenylobacterium sp. TaxID=1871053 RepID=UPI002F91F6C5
MSQPNITMDDAPTSAQPVTASAAQGWKLVEEAPAHELADEPSKAGRQIGLAIALGGAALFWGAVAGAVFLLRAN